MGSGKFRIAVGAVIENSNNEILLLKRSDYGAFPGIWDIAGGGKNQLENPYDTLSREIKEETGIMKFEIIKLLYIYTGSLQDQSYLNPDIIGFIFWCKTQETKVTLSHEHTEFKWLKLDDALEIATHKDVIGSIQSLIKEKQRISKK